MITWHIACTKGVLLFRVLGEQDDASRDIYPRDPHATLSVDDHISKGPNSPFGSQFISTTRDLEMALKMTFKRRSTLAVILGPHLDQDIKLLDLSSGHPDLEPVNSLTAKRFSEVLLGPYINSNAMLNYTYDELVEFHNFDCGRNDLLDCSTFRIMHDVLESFQSFICESCGKEGHDLFEGHFCSETYAFQIYDSLHCDHCGANGHPIEHCSDFEDEFYDYHCSDLDDEFYDYHFSDLDDEFYDYYCSDLE